MNTCPRCGSKLRGEIPFCIHCDPETIHEAGEVIPPNPAAQTDSTKGSSKRSPFFTALLLAVAADLLQMVFFPAFMGGVESPLSDLLDVVVGVIMVRLLGWHWAFLPSFMGKLVPFFDELPCWTLAVFFVRTQKSAELGSATRSAT